MSHLALVPGLLSPPRRAAERVVALGPSTDPNAKLTLVTIGAEGARTAVKLATTTVAAAALERERAALLEVRARCALDPALLATLPEPLPQRDWNAAPALVCTAVPGTSLNTVYHRRGHTSSAAHVATDFALAQAWLASLHAATADGPRVAARLGLDVLSALEARYAGDPRLDAVRAVLREAAAALLTVQVRRTASHGDFWCGNILVTGDRVTGVVDWESAEPAGEPLRDVARFAVSYALYLDRHTRAGHGVPGHRGLRAGEPCGGLVHALTGRGWFPDLFAHFLRTSLHHWDADPDGWYALALVGVADVAAHADSPAFAAQHLDCLVQLVGRPR